MKYLSYLLILLIPLQLGQINGLAHMGQLGQAPEPLVGQIQQNGQSRVRTAPDAQIVNDGTNDRVLIGAIGDGDFGIKVSQSGTDVKTATSSQLVMSSGFNMFKIVASGTVRLDIPASMVQDQVASVSVAHGLGVAPAFTTFITGGTAYGMSAGQILQMPFSSRYIVAGTIRGFFYADCYTDSTSITFRYTNESTITDTTAGYIDFKYYMFQETAN